MKNIYVQVTEQDLHNIDINDLVHQGLLFRLVKPTRSIESIFSKFADDCGAAA